jgi:hypothetical protein
MTGLLAASFRGSMVIRQSRFVILGLAAALIGVVPAAAAPWTRGFVVGTYEPAFHYGGRAGFARTGEVEPGSDCTRGSTVHFSNPDHVKEALRRQRWRDPADIEKIGAPPGLDQVPGPATTRFSIWGRAVSYRGWKKGIETYVNPFAAEDTGQPEVTGRISDGLDLDNNPATGFTSPDGRRGVDNNLYKAWGCDAPWRGNGNATLDLRANDKMLDGMFTIAVRVSGTQDAMHDDNAVVEIGYSPDRIIRDARSQVARDYSYRLPHTSQYTRLKATIHDGVVETEQVADLHMPRMAWIYDQVGDAFFRQGKLRLVIKPDGTMTGIVAGYRDWRDVYNQNTFAQSGGEQGVREHEDAIALYYALKRNADGMKDADTGRYLGISTAYRITATPAFVVDPAAPVGFNIQVPEEARKRAFQAVSDAVIKSTTTRIVQNVPPGTTEAAVPRFEKITKGLPSRDYFLKLLDRPHYGYQSDDDGNILLDLPEAPQPSKPQRQVNNEVR